MSFTPIDDDLAWEMVTLIGVALIFVWVGGLSWLSIRRHSTADLRANLKGAAMPLALMGVAIFAIAFWEEVTWPFVYSDGLGSYNILFADTYFMFGIATLAFAACAWLGQRLQFAGLLAFAFGVITIGYAWNAYQLGLTNAPWEMFALFGAFGVAAIFTLPATLIADHYLRHSDRAAASPDGSVKAPWTERLPVIYEGLMLAFPLFWALAFLAAAAFLWNTIPAHLASPP